MRKRPIKEEARVLGRMEVLDMDRILSDSQEWWMKALAWVAFENPQQSPKTITASGACSGVDCINMQTGSMSNVVESQHVVAQAAPRQQETWEKAKG